MALELTYASDATLLLDDLVDSLGRPGSAAGVVVPVLMPSLPLVDRTKAALGPASRGGHGRSVPPAWRLYRTLGYPFNRS